MITLRTDPFPQDAELHQFWTRAWGNPPGGSFQKIFQRSLCHIGAYAETRLVGFINVATDGGIHAFILDTAVDPEFRHQGIATALVREAAATATARGAQWLHVDYEPHLDGFYRGCGFRPSAAGVMKLGANK